LQQLSARPRTVEAGDLLLVAFPALAQTDNDVIRPGASAASRS